MTLVKPGLFGVFILSITWGIFIIFLDARVDTLEEHTHEIVGVQIGDAICLEYGTLHYPDPFSSLDAHIDAVFCGEVEDERFPALGKDTHLITP